jgi:hypothetical protein
LILLSLLLWPTPASAQKTDVIVLTNGDRVTTEIKELQRGRIRASTDGMGTVYIEWDDIDRLSSPARHEVVLDSGERFVGALETTGTPREVLIRADEPVALSLDRIVRITPANQRFWEQLDGAVDLGYNFANAGDTTQLTLSVSATRRAERVEVSFNADSFFSAKEGAEDTSRHSLGMSVLRDIGQRWGLITLGQFERNEELQLALRSQLGGGYVRRIIQSNVVTLLALAGAAINREEFLDDTPGQNNVEGAFGVDFQWFTYDTPKTDVATSFYVFPSINSWGRTRLELDAQLRRELVSDFFFNVAFRDSFDSDSPSAGGARNDFNVVTSFGWTF